MSDQTLEALRQLAEQSSSPDRKISPMQVAALILEEVLAAAKGD
jgi:hypothetical protein